ncbi:MAG: Hpt domain-containing protein [Clostridia bacterium]|nr:Hpt domain-containing protein [Clostridia bacterium]
MTVDEIYPKIGGNLDEVLKRIPSKGIIAKFAKKFIDDPSFAQIKPFIDQKNWNEAFRMAHTLKGVALNLGFGKLGASASELTEAMRNGVALTDIGLYNKVVEDYNLTISYLKQLD